MTSIHAPDAEFWPENTKAEFYIPVFSGGISIPLSYAIKQALEYFGLENTPEAIEKLEITAEHLHTHHIYHDMHDPSDYTNFLVFVCEPRE